MKKFFLSMVLVVVSSASFAEPVTAAKLPKDPPPYGAYVLGGVRSSYAQAVEIENAIARHYGFKDGDAAKSACVKIRPDCVDPVRHLRDGDPRVKAELKKYGLASWEGAINACVTNLERGDMQYCQVDPFLKLRLGLKK